MTALSFAAKLRDVVGAFGITAAVAYGVARIERAIRLRRRTR